jgi:hypothetical protein
MTSDRELSDPIDGGKYDWIRETAASESYMDPEHLRGLALRYLCEAKEALRANFPAKAESLACLATDLLRKASELEQRTAMDELEAS